jgi:hypothetical protein
MNFAIRTRTIKIVALRDSVAQNGVSITAPVAK